MGGARRGGRHGARALAPRRDAEGPRQDEGPDLQHSHPNRPVSSAAPSISLRAALPSTHTDPHDALSLSVRLFSLVAIGLVIIAGVVVLNFQFEKLNANIESLAVTGELARPLLKDGASLANNFNNLTGTLTTDLGITGNNSVASGVRDFANQISDAGRQLFS